MMSRMTAPEREVATPITLGSSGSSRLRAGVEQSLRSQLLLQFLKAQIEVAHALARHRIHVELVTAALHEHRGRAAHGDAHAVLGREGQLRRLLPPEHALHARSLIF